MEKRVSRATTSIFRFNNGLTIGSLTHTILLHEMVSGIAVSTASYLNMEERHFAWLAGRELVHFSTILDNSTDWSRLQVFHTALEVVCDGLHVLIDDPYGPKIGVQYRLPKSNEYHQVCQIFCLRRYANTTSSMRHGMPAEAS